MKKDQKNTYRHLIKNGVVYKLFVLAIGSFVLSSLNSCKKLVNIDPAGSTLLTSSVFTDSVTVQSTLAGLYLNSLYRANTSIYPGFSADELQYVGTSYDPYINDAILSNDATVGVFWNSSYMVIYNANAIIEGVTGSTSLSPRFKTQALAEARFMRAFCYFYLVNLWGDVPLILSTDVNQNATLGRTATADVYAQMIADLKFAQANLPADYSASAGTRTRANKWIATAMLAKVDLYTGNWADAETQASAVISNTALFSLLNDLSKVFTPSNTEAIWQFYNDPSGYTVYANTVLPNATTKIPTYVLTPSLTSAFEAGDARKTNWTATLVYNGTTYTYPAKYKSTVTGGNVEYFTILRLAEMYLIRAEARANQSNISGAVADINVLRARARATPADLPNYPATIGKDACLADIAHERQVELNCENGNRWFDLKRTGAVNAVIGALKPIFWKPTAALYPIPSLAITLNGNLKQNPGYN
jgi:hypothetical protein